MVLITGKAFTILGLVVKWSDLRIQRCTAMNAGSATGSHGARYIRVQNSDIRIRDSKRDSVYNLSKIKTKTKLIINKEHLPPFAPQ